MVTLEEHIKLLRECDALDPTTSAVCRYFLLVTRDHYVEKDNTHKALSLFAPPRRMCLDGKAGFVDSTGARLTVEEFFNAITAPEPPEPQRHAPWARKNVNVPRVQGKTQESMGSRPYVPLS